MAIERISPNDTRVEKVGGMKKQHACRLVAFCQVGFPPKKLLVIVRGSKPTSLQHHRKEDHFPKPLKEKTKIPYATGAIDAGGGEHFISDYDLQGVYELRDNGAYYRFYVSNGAHAKPLGPFDSPFLAAINNYVEKVDDPKNALFQHGPNDDFLDKGRPQNEGIGDVFLAFAPDSGEVFLIDSRNDLKDFYASRGISYNY